MLPVDGPVPDGPGWIAQPKMDGWRAVVDASAGRPARIWSRHGTDLTGRFVALARQLDDLDVVLDGELVVFGRDGLPRFSQLSARRPAGTVRLVAFDLLAVAGRPLHDVALEGRLEALEDLPLPDAVQVAAAGPPAAMWTAVCQVGLEGIVSKRLAGRYLPGRRSGAWRRTKNWTESELGLLSVVHDDHGRPGAVVVAGPDGRPCGRVELGVGQVAAQLAAVPAGVTLDGTVKVVVRHHGTDGTLRDAHLLELRAP